MGVWRMYNMHKLQQAVTHGDFTPGHHYPLIKQGRSRGERAGYGFYYDNTGAIRRLPTDVFGDVTGAWTPPEPPEYLEQKARAALASRYGIHKQTVYLWQQGKKPFLWLDVLAGSKLPRHDEPLPDIAKFVQENGFYLQELGVRWGMNEWGSTIRDLNPAYFWDLWRGMILNTTGAV